MPATGNSGAGSRAADQASALPCGSASTSSTRLPAVAKTAARLTAMLVLPTPPFWLHRPTIRLAIRFGPPSMLSYVPIVRVEFEHARPVIVVGLAAAPLIANSPRPAFSPRLSKRRDRLLDRAPAALQ